MSSCRLAAAGRVQAEAATANTRVDAISSTEGEMRCLPIMTLDHKPRARWAVSRAARVSAACRGPHFASGGASVPPRRCGEPATSAEDLAKHRAVLTQHEADAQPRVGPELLRAMSSEVLHRRTHILEP